MRRPRRRPDAARPIAAGDPPGAHAGPVARVRLDDSVAAAHRRSSKRRCRPPNSRRRCSTDCARAYRPGTGMADAFGRWLEAGARPARAGRLRLLGSGRQAAGRDALRARDRTAPAQTARLAAEAGRGPGGARLSRAGRRRRTAAVALFHLNGGRAADPRLARQTAFQVGDASSRGRAPRTRPAARTSSARTCCCVRSCRTRCSPRSVTSPGRTSWPISASCAASTTLRRPDAADVPARDGDPRRFQRRCGSSRDTTLPLEPLRRRTKRALNQLLEAQLPPARRRRRCDDVARALEERMEQLAHERAQIDRDARRRRALDARRGCRTISRSSTAKSSRPPSARTTRCAASFTMPRRRRFPAAIRRNGGRFRLFLNKYGPALVDRLIEELPTRYGHSLGRHDLIDR